jgi:hypothetical protein
MEVFGRSQVNKSESKDVAAGFMPAFKHHERFILELECERKARGYSMGIAL